MIEQFVNPTVNDRTDPCGASTLQRSNAFPSGNRRGGHRPDRIEPCGDPSVALWAAVPDGTVP
ncbi:hypothetical protein [Ensifer sp. Root423]